MLAVIVLLLACAAGPADTGVGADGGGSGGGSSDGGWQDDTPDISADAVAARIDAALAVGLPDPGGLLASIDALVALPGAADCHVESRTFNAGMRGCTTPEGWTIGGLLIFEDEGADEWSIEGDAWAISPEGQRWTGAGDVTWLRFGEDWTFVVAGTWGGAPFDQGWLAPGTSLAATLVHDETCTTLEGGYDPGDAVYFDGLSAGADDSLSGAVLYRDPAGPWYRLEPADGGCGAVTRDGRTLGEGCIDLAPAIDDLVAAVETL